MALGNCYQYYYEIHFIIQRPFTANIDHPDTQTNDMNGEYYFFAYPNPDLSLCDF